MKYCLLLLCFFCSNRIFAQQTQLVKKVLRTKNLIALWDFQEEAGNDRASLKGNYALAETNGQIERNSEGPLSGYSAKFGQGPYFSLSNDKTKALNIHGQNQGVTVVAWVKWTGEQTGFVGGMWNEYQDGGKRQYGLFVSLPHYNGKNQVWPHLFNREAHSSVSVFQRLFCQRAGGSCQCMDLRCL